MAQPATEIPPMSATTPIQLTNPTTPPFSTDEEFIGAYMIIHVGSYPTRRWGYILWFIIGGIFLLFTVAHLLNLRTGLIGAYWHKWALRRKTLRNKFLTGGKPESLNSNAQLLTLTVLTIAVLLLALAGPDYIAPKTGAFELTRRAASLMPRQFHQYVDPALAAPFQPSYNINKAWWTSGNRTGILAFALLPLCIMFALKAPPFAIFAIPHLVQLHFDKLSWLHRWSGRLIWFVTFLHALFWVIQLCMDRRRETGVIALKYALIYDRFIYAVISFVLMTFLILGSLSPIRRNHYELFYFLHILFVPLMIITAALHHPPIWWWCWAALGLWFGERTWRLTWWLYTNGILGGMPKAPASRSLTDTKAASPAFQMMPTKSSRHYKQLSDVDQHHRAESGSYSVASPLLQPKTPSGYIPPQGHYVPPPGYAYAELLTGMTVRVTFITPNFRSWAPGQHFLICMPSISAVQSHPFTCGSICDEQAPEDAGRALVFFIRAKNGWTRQLWNKVVKLTSRGQLHPPGERPPIGTQPPTRGVLLRMYVDGPFGSVVRAKWEHHSTVLIVAGGSGVSFGLSLLIYTCMCLAGRDGKHLGGRPGGWGMKGYRPTRVRFVWIVREFAHIVWCATAIRRCLDIVPGSSLQIDIFVTHFKRLSDMKAGPPSPLMPAMSLPMDTPSIDPSETEALYPPAPRFARQQGSGSRSSSVDSTGSAPDTNSYVDLTYYTSEYGDEERDVNDPDVYRQNYILDLTNFEGDNDAAIFGEDTFNRRVMKTGKARRAKTRKATNAESARRELDQRAPHPPPKQEGRGRVGWPGRSQESSGEWLSPGSHDEQRRSPSALRTDLPSGSGSGPHSASGSRSGSRPGSPMTTVVQHTPPDPPDAHSMKQRTLSDKFLDSHDPKLIRAPSPYAHEFGLTGEGASLRGLVTECEENVRLDVDDQELRDVAVVSEHARPGKPKLDRILADEVQTANGSVIVACCGPTSLNAIIRKTIAAQINPSRIRRGDMRGSIALIADEFAY